MKYKIKVIKNYPQKHDSLYVYEEQEYESSLTAQEILEKHIHVIECVEIKPKKEVKKK